MLQSNHLNNLSVALLLSEIEDVKEITQVFRKLGIIPHFYEDLKSFWHGTLERMPALAIVDVKKMNEGGMILKNHPMVMNEELPLLFFYSEKTEPLLISTQEIYHLGTVKKASRYEGTFKSLLKRINKVILLEQENHHLKFNLQAKSEEIKKVELEKNNLVKVDHYQSLSKEICRLLDEQKNEPDFFNSLEKIIQKVSEFENFSLVELSFNGQKLISPISHMRKYRSIPSLWLGQVCKNGIELFAQNMATQVAQELLGDRVISLLINDHNGKPSMMLFVKAIDDLCFEHFDWNLLESFLNGYHAIFKLRERRESNSSHHFQSSFEAMSFIDQLVFGGNIIESSSNKLERVEYRLVNLDLNSILNILQKNGTQRFYFKKFKEDFIARLELQSNCEFRSFENGVSDLGFIVKYSDIDYFFDELKSFVNKFSFWKYFENNESILFQEISPKVKMSPMSSYAYIKLVSEAHFGEIKVSKSNEIMWNRAVENEI